MHKMNIQIPKENLFRWLMSEPAEINSVTIAQPVLRQPQTVSLATEK